MSRGRRFVGVMLIPVATAVICAVGVLVEAGVYMQYKRVEQAAYRTSLGGRSS